MGTHEARIGRLEKTIDDSEEGLCKRVETNSKNFVKVNIKMNAIIWLFGLIIALGIANIVMGQI